MKNIKKSLFFITFIFIANLLFAELYMNEATVSFYAEDFHGKKTSSGELFNMNALTCASKTFPFDTELKVTNLSNGKSVIVRVNDRGPFVPDRELDLSKAAAIQLGMIASGTTTVKIEIVKMGPETKLSTDTANSANRIMTERFGANWNKSAATVAKSNSGTSTTVKTTSSKSTANTNQKTVESAAAGDLFEIQIASFSQKENAHQTAKKLYNLGYREIYIRTSGDVYRVILKGYKKSQLEKVEADLKKNNYKDYIIRVQK